MAGKKRSNDAAISEIQSLRLRLKELEKSESKRKKVEKALIETDQRLYSIIEGSPIPAFMIGKDHKIIYWNKALEELSRIKAKDVIGTRQQWRAFYSKKRPCMADILVKSKIEDVPKWYQGKYIKSNLLDDAYEATDFFPELGEKGKWLRFTAAIIRNAAGELVGAVETLEDITGRKKAEAALMQAHEGLEHSVALRTAELAKANEALLAELMERHRTQQALKQTTDHLSLILESLPIVSYTRKADGDFGITFVSNTIEEITGYPAQRFIEEDGFWKDHIHPDDRLRVITELQEEQKKGAHRFGYRFRIMDDSYRWFSEIRKVRHLKRDNVFTYKGKPVKNIKRSFSTACKQAGVEGFRFHDLRHTFNTNMRKAGVDRSIIMEITGHKTMSMFERYNTIDSDDALDAMKRYDEFLHRPAHGKESTAILLQAP
jgi:PAS domain S-box-containing protein